jgi:hypothetical protein
MRDWLLVLCHHRRHNLAKLIWESQQWTIRNFTRNGWVWTIKPLRSNPKLKNWRLTSGFNMVQPSLSVTNHQKLGASHVTSLYGTPQWAFPMACSLRSPISQGARSPGRRCPFPSVAQPRCTAATYWVSRMGLGAASQLRAVSNLGTLGTWMFWAARISADCGKNHGVS